MGKDKQPRRVFGFKISSTNIGLMISQFIKENPDFLKDKDKKNNEPKLPKK
jgi:hypothetical protein